MVDQVFSAKAWAWKTAGCLDFPLEAGAAAVEFDRGEYQMMARTTARPSPMLTRRRKEAIHRGGTN